MLSILISSGLCSSSGLCVTDGERKILRKAALLSGPWRGGLPSPGDSKFLQHEECKRRCQTACPSTQLLRAEMDTEATTQGPWCPRSTQGNNMLRSGQEHVRTHVPRTDVAAVAVAEAASLFSMPEMVAGVSCHLPSLSLGFMPIIWL